MAKLFLLGEAYGEQEEKERTPFVGAAGYHLTQMLEEVGIHRADCYLSNVFNIHPPGNRIEYFLGPKETAIGGYPQLLKGKQGYVQREWLPELERLSNEIIAENPNLIVAMGNTALWSLSGKVGISNIRGTTLLSTLTVSGYKILPTYHPAAILRQWELRATTVADLLRAKREQDYPEIRRPKRWIWIEPTLEDLDVYYETQIKGCSLLSVDIETAGTIVTCIGFAPSPESALVVPFTDHRKKTGSYWPDVQTEQLAWRYCARILSDKAIPKLFQNGLYDIAFLWRSVGLPTYAAEEDTMLLHHALHPESLKGLGFLSSVYGQGEGAWKQMREKTKTIKADD